MYYMIARRIIGTIWGILTIPSAFLALFSQLCDSPYGCSNSTFDYVISGFFITLPLFFIAGAVGGWLPERFKKLGLILLWAPVVLILVFVGVTFLQRNF